MKHPTLTEIRAAFEYDQKSGGLFWKASPKHRVGKIQPGQRAGWPCSKGYRGITLNGQDFKEHRLVWFYHTGDWADGFQIDHINRIRDDNRIDNLRLATSGQNGANSPKSAKNRSGYKGVSFKKAIGKYVAQIKSKGRVRHLGVFYTAEEAYAAYVSEAQKVHGAFFHP